MTAFDARKNGSKFLEFHFFNSKWCAYILNYIKKHEACNYRMTNVLHQLNTIRFIMTKGNKQQMISKKESARNGHAQINTIHIDLHVFYYRPQFKCIHVLIRQNTTDRTPAPHTHTQNNFVWNESQFHSYLYEIKHLKYCITMPVFALLWYNSVCCCWCYVCGGVYIRAKNHNLLLLYTTTFLSPQNEYIWEYNTLCCAYEYVRRRRVVCEVCRMVADDFMINN